MGERKEKARDGEIVRGRGEERKPKKNDRGKKMKAKSLEKLLSLLKYIAINDACTSTHFCHNLK